MANKRSKPPTPDEPGIHAPSARIHFLYPHGAQLHPYLDENTLDMTSESALVVQGAVVGEDEFHLTGQMAAWGSGWRVEVSYIVGIKFAQPLVLDLTDTEATQEFLRAHAAWAGDAMYSLTTVIANQLIGAVPICHLVLPSKTPNLAYDQFEYPGPVPI